MEPKRTLHSGNLVRGICAVSSKMGRYERGSTLEGIIEIELKRDVGK